MIGGARSQLRVRGTFFVPHANVVVERSYGMDNIGVYYVSAESEGENFATSFPWSPAQRDELFPTVSRACLEGFCSCLEILSFVSGDLLSRTCRLPSSRSVGSTHEYENFLIASTEL